MFDKWVSRVADLAERGRVRKIVRYINDEIIMLNVDLGAIDARLAKIYENESDLDSIAGLEIPDLISRNSINARINALESVLAFITGLENNMAIPSKFLADQ